MTWSYPQLLKPCLEQLLYLPLECLFEHLSALRVLLAQLLPALTCDLLELLPNDVQMYIPRVHVLTSKHQRSGFFSWKDWSCPANPNMPSRIGLESRKRWVLPFLSM